MKTLIEDVILVALRGCRKQHQGSLDGNGMVSLCTSLLLWPASVCLEGFGLHRYNNL
jgi:hypothetical protein